MLTSIFNGYFSHIPSGGKPSEFFLLDITFWTRTFFTTRFLMCTGTQKKRSKYKNQRIFRAHERITPFESKSPNGDENAEHICSSLNNFSAVYFLPQKVYIIGKLMSRPSLQCAQVYRNIGYFYTNVGRKQGMCVVSTIQGVHAFSRFWDRSVTVNVVRKVL